MQYFADAVLLLGYFSGFVTSSANLNVTEYYSSTEQGGRMLLKTVVSDRFRLVFSMGLEGTGHHYAYAVEDNVFRDNPGLPRIDGGTPNSKTYFVPNFVTRNPEAFLVAEEASRQIMKQRAERAADLPWPGTLQLQRGGISYPSGNGPGKVFQYIDMRRMAETAELEGVDFRVLYLRRSAKGLLIANTVHRDFQDSLGLAKKTTPEQRFMAYVKIIFTQMSVVNSLLSEVDPAFIVCHDWDKLGDVDQAKTISAHIAPNEEFGVHLTEAIVSTAGSEHHDSANLPPFDGIDVIVERLQRKLDAFENVYCTAER